MTNYNERPDDLTSFMESINWEFDENGYTFEDNYINFRAAEMLRRALTSLIKELVAEAKPYNEQGEIDIDNPAYNDGYYSGAYGAIEKFEQNLLKALEEV